MHVELLTDIGLSLNEARIYNTLLEIKGGTISAIARHAGIDRRNVYDTMQRLIKRGLAYQILPKKILTYAPVHPEKLKEFLTEKMDDLEDSLPGLIKKFDLASSNQQIFIYKGIQGLKNYIKLVLKTGKAVHSIGAKGSWFDPRVASFAKRASKTWATKKVGSKIIYDWEIRNHPDVTRMVGKDYKFLPKKYSSDSQVDIVGDYIVIYSGINIKELDDDITMFVLRDKTLAKDYSKWFEFMWDMLPERNSKKKK